MILYFATGPRTLVLNWTIAPLLRDFLCPRTLLQPVIDSATHRNSSIFSMSSLLVHITKNVSSVILGDWCLRSYVNT